MKTACDYTLCLTSENEHWKTILDSKRPVILFGTISKLGLQPTRHWSVIHEIIRRIAAIFSDEVTQTLRPPMLEMFRYQAEYKETSSLRCFFGDSRQLPALSYSSR